jgi:preprotein translocase subunit SecG
VVASVLADAVSSKLTTVLTSDNTSQSSSVTISDVVVVVVVVVEFVIFLCWFALAILSSRKKNDMDVKEKSKPNPSNFYSFCGKSPNVSTR